MARALGPVDAAEPRRKVGSPLALTATLVEHHRRRLPRPAPVGLITRALQQPDRLTAASREYVKRCTIAALSSGIAPTLVAVASLDPRPSGGFAHLDAVVAKRR